MRHEYVRVSTEEQTETRQVLRMLYVMIAGGRLRAA